MISELSKWGLTLFLFVFYAVMFMVIREVSEDASYVWLFGVGIIVFAFFANIWQF